jgi:hypothetical protein
MKAPLWIVVLFALAAAYDGVLGLLFLAAPGYPFEVFHVTPPNHLGYVQFPAALLMIFGLMFVVIALDPAKNRDLILYGILLKVAYCGVTLAHWLATDIPWIWKPFTIIDVVMGVLFVWAYAVLPRDVAQQETG